MNGFTRSACGLALSLMSGLSPALACETPATVCFSARDGAFPLIDDNRPATVLIDRNADPAIRNVAGDFAEDLRRVSGRRAKVIEQGKRLGGPVVVIGSAGKSPLIDGLVAEGKLDLSGLDGRWEAFEIEVVDNPWPDVGQALVIAGSDRRGAVFGAYDVSEEMGVSPWHYFADAPTARRKNVSITAGERSEAPGVRYRGFFINDEDPALRDWAE